jgi:hypothetical protein
MGEKPQFYLTVAGVIILFDVVASFASRGLRFDYAFLSWVTLCLYFVSGYFGYKFHGLLGGALAGLVAGLADSTVGWTLSSVVGAYVPSEGYRPTPLFIAAVVIIVTLKATFFGLVGALLGWFIRGRSPVADA